MAKRMVWLSAVIVLVVAGIVEACLGAITGTGWVVSFVILTLLMLLIVAIIVDAASHATNRASAKEPTGAE